MSRELILYGLGEHGRVVLDTALELGWTVLGFADDIGPSRDVPGFPHLGPFEEACARYPGASWHVAIGTNAARDQAMGRVRLQTGHEPVSLIHPKAWVSGHAVIGPGSWVAPMAVVATASVLGAGCIVNHGASIDHDAQLGVCVHVAPGARLPGRITLGDRVFVGCGASFVPGIRVGADAVVGAGAVVIKDVQEGVTVVGNPARPLGS
ncbi:MAG: acetyltransferase [Planctomycetota bacterium]